MNNFIQRTLTAIVFVAVLLGSTFLGQFSFSVLFGIITLLGVLEFYTLAEKANVQAQKIMGVLTSVTLFFCCALIASETYDVKLLLLVVPLVFSIFILELYTFSANPFTNIAYTILGIVYVALPFSLLNFITSFSGAYSYEILFGFFFILWSNDSGAYLVGSAMGKKKLFPRVSPGKTWEGSIGGAVASFAVAYFISQWYTVISLTDWLVVAAILVVVGTLGDLVESLFKRSIQVKDSGKVLPGHGGILDRFDSLIVATPFVFTYLYLIKELIG